MSITYVVMLALLTGTHAATWGAFKDSPFEGFKPVSFVRTIVLAVLAAAVLALTTDLETTMAPLVFMGLIYAVERLATELWKSFIREDDQDAYAIPMRIAVLGRTVDGRGPRYLMGVVIFVAVVAMAFIAATLQPANGGPLYLLVLVGGIGGWLTAVGGAWKDAPVEGFSGWKFLRSPVVATAWTIMLLAVHPGLGCADVRGCRSVGPLDRDLQDLLHRRPPSRQVRRQADASRGRSPAPPLPAPALGRLRVPGIRRRHDSPLRPVACAVIRAWSRWWCSPWSRRRSRSASHSLLQGLHPPYGVTS